MTKLCDTQIPQTDLLHSFRLFSNNGVSYFGVNEPNCALHLSMIDRVDQPIRILSDFMSKIGCRIGSHFCGVDSNKDALKEMWNNVKREEKIIRSDGLNLKKINGETFYFKDPSYRVYWPSFESFTLEYPLSSKIGWVNIDIPLAMEQQRNIIKSRPDIFKAKITSELLSEYERICFVVDIGEIRASSDAWRRITENIVSILVISEKVEV